MIVAAGSNAYRWGSTFFIPPTDNSATVGSTSFRWSNLHSINAILYPPSSVTPTVNGSMTFELTNDTTLKIKVKGSDGTVRSTTLTLA
jgi:hypothetical protein